MKIIFVILLLSFLAACGGHEVDFARSLAVKAPADLILRGGKIVTVDDEFSIREAVAIKDGRFLAVGTDREVRPLMGPATTVIDLAGRTVIPGLNDSSIQATVACLRWDAELHWQSTRTLADALNQISAAAKTRPPGIWIVVGGGWVPTQFAERRFPTRADLDALAPNHPVYIQYLREGALLNSAALAAVGISSGTPDPIGGKFERHSRTGELSGWLQGEPAWRFAYDKIPRLSLDAARRSLRNCFRELNRLGITSIGDVQPSAVTFAHRRVLADMARSRDLPLRINFYVAADETGDRVSRLKLAAAELQNLQPLDNFRFAGFAESLGDVFTAASSATAKEKFRPRAGFVAEGGRNFQLAAGGDAAARQWLDVFEEVHAVTPLGPRRIIFTDLDDPTRETIERIKKLGGAIVVQSRMALSGERKIEAWGLEKTRNAPPLRMMIEAGIPLGAGSGAFQSANYSPMLSLSWLVTGQTIAGTRLRSESQNLTRAEALRLYTMGGAWLTLEESRKGSIEVGKYADLAVLNADYLTVPEEQIRSLQSLLTVVGGTVVYTAAPFDSLEQKGERRRAR